MRVQIEHGILAEAHDKFTRSSFARHFHIPAAEPHSTLWHAAAFFSQDVDREASEVSLSCSLVSWATSADSLESDSIVGRLNSLRLATGPARMLTPTITASVFIVGP